MTKPLLRKPLKKVGRTENTSCVLARTSTIKVENAYHLGSLTASWNRVFRSDMFEQTIY